MAAILSLLLAASIAIPAAADYDPATNYMTEMVEAAAAGDIEGGLSAQQSRDEKIAQSGDEYVQVDFMDLYLVAKIIQAEAGSNWLSDYWKMAVGEVVLNRVASPEFPNTVEEVIYQSGQYYTRSNSFFKRLVPTAHSAALAARLLEGERVIGDPSVVFQANFTLGSGVAVHLYDSALGSTYLCYSSRPWLYES